MLEFWSCEELTSRNGQERESCGALVGSSVQTLTKAVLESCHAEAMDTTGTLQCNSSLLSWALRRLQLQPHGSEIAGQYGKIIN